MLFATGVLTADFEEFEVGTKISELGGSNDFVMAMPYRKGNWCTIVRIPCAFIRPIQSDEQWVTVSAAGFDKPEYIAQGIAEGIVEQHPSIPDLCRPGPAW